MPAAGSTWCAPQSASASPGKELENLTLTGATAINATGNARANRITGNAAANLIEGGDGTDMLTGGGGADTFFFTAAPGGTNIDVVTDYAVVDDTIRLSAVTFTRLSRGGAGGRGRRDRGGCGCDRPDHLHQRDGGAALRCGRGRRWRGGAIRRALHRARADGCGFTGDLNGAALGGRARCRYV